MKTVLSVFGLLVALCASGNAQPEIQEPWRVVLAEMPFSWPQQVSQSVSVTKANVIQLLNEIDKAQSVKEKAQGIVVDRDPDIQEDVENYAFAVLDDGIIYLVAASDSSPRKSFDEISVVHCNGRACTLASIHTDESGIDFNRQLIDLNGNGRRQIIAYISFSPGQERWLASEHVFEVVDGAATDNSSNYPQYYESKVLPRLAKEEQNVPSDSPDAEMLKAEWLYGQQDIRRRILGERESGMAEASQWEQSDDERIKMLAVATYEAVDTPDAEAGLRRMSLSKSKWVREQANDALARKAAKAADSPDPRR